MSKVSSQLWQLASWLEEQMEQTDWQAWDWAAWKQQAQDFVQQWTHPRRRWLAASAAAGLMLALNWRLMVTAGLGVGAATLWFRVAQMPQNHPTKRRVQRSLKRAKQTLEQRLSRPSGWAIASSSLVLLSVYSAFRVGQPFGEPWLATMLLAQGGLLLAVIGALQGKRQGGVYPYRMRPAAAEAWMKPGRSLDHWLDQLTHPNPLTRLLAIRHTTQIALAASDTDPLPLRTYLADCFRLMAQTEQHPIVQQALADHLTVLAPTPQLGMGAPPLVTPRPLRLGEDDPLEPLAVEGDRPSSVAQTLPS